MAGLTTLVKGHGTEDDFLLAADPIGDLDVDDAAVAFWCDRGRGLGADGLLLARPATSGAAEWAMDHRRADGTLAGLCGNALRVFVAFLRHTGLVELADGESVVIGTPSGEHRVWARGDLYTVEMGDFLLPGGVEAAARGFDVAVKLPGLEQRPGLRVATPGPHTVVALDSPAALAGLTLTTARFDPEPPDGTTLDVVVPLGELPDGRGWIRMRVLERDGGEARSSGTGSCAAAVAVREWGGAGAPDEWVVEVPGGALDVRIDGTRVFLTGPAVLVAEISLLDGPPAP